MSLSVGAQDSCRRTEHLGDLRSHQTITRVGLLNSSSCRFDGVRYYDYYDFQLTGAGEIRFSLSSSDFFPQVVLNTISGEFLAADHYNLTRTLPAGGYKVIAVSDGTEDAGSYTLTVRTGQLAAPPPPPPPPPETRTNGDDVDQDDEQVVPPDETEVVRGQVIARVHPLPENDRRGRYRIEFGFLSAEVLASGTDRTAVVDANEHLLPPRRYLNEASLLARGRANDRRWLRSDPVDVLSMEGDDAGLSGEPLLTGRVIARWNPTPGGRFRVEFGFLPDWAFEAAGDDTERAAERYAGLLPEPRRYLTENRINSELRRDQPRWLTSSVVEIFDNNEPQRHCDTVTITAAGVPITLERGERITDEAIATVYGQLAETFTPIVVSGLPPGLTYDVDESRADGCEYQVTVSGTIPPQTPARTYSVAVTAEGAVGDPTTQTVLIDPGMTTLDIGEWGGYNPATTTIGGAVGIVQPRVVSPFPAPPGVVWSFETRTADVCSVDSRTGALTLIGAGACQVTVTASAPGYKAAIATADVTVGGPPIPILIWSGYNPSSIEVSDTAPTILPRRAMVNGLEVYPEYRYSVAPGSSSVCSVNEATGALTISGVGQCRILLTNVAKPPEYGVGSADATVTVRPGDPDLRWQGYSPSTAQLDDPAPRLLRPTADARSIEFSYRTLTPSICGADSGTGALTLMREGNCIVMVSTSGNPNYRDATARATVVIETPVPRPEIDSVSCSPPRPSVGDSVTCRAQLSGGEPDEWLWIGGNSDENDDPSFTTTFGAEGQQTVWLSVSNSAGSDTDSATVEVQPGEPPDVTISCSSSSIDEGESVTCSVTRNRGGAIDNYDWSASGGRPSSGSSSTYSPRFSSEGSYTVWLTASNAGGDDDASATVRVEGNGDPECSSVRDVEYEKNDARSVYVECTDPDDDPITLRGQSSDTRIATVDSTANPWVRIRTAGRVGSATITVTATDGRGGSGSVSFMVTVGESPPPDITISCSPSSIDEGESVTCEVSRNRGGAIDSYDWSASGGRPSSGSSSTYSPRFSSEGSYTVRLTARNAGGSDSDSATVRVEPEPEVEPPDDPPDPSISCTARVMQGDRASCRVDRNRGGDIDRYSWSATGGASSGSSSTYRPRFSSYGRQTVRLTASNDGGSGSNSLPVDVVADPEGWTYARCGSDTIRVYWFSSTNLTKHWLNMTWEEVTIRVPGWGEHLIGRLSQAECNSWPDGRVVTYDNW